MLKERTSLCARNYKLAGRPKQPPYVSHKRDFVPSLYVCTRDTCTTVCSRRGGGSAARDERLVEGLEQAGHLALAEPRAVRELLARGRHDRAQRAEGGVQRGLGVERRGLSGFDRAPRARRWGPALSLGGWVAGRLVPSSAAQRAWRSQGPGGQAGELRRHQEAPLQSAARPRPSCSPGAPW